MGVDITTYRKRIGSIHHGKESGVSTVQFSVNGIAVLGTLHALGAVAFIGILLVISGIEQNPGPGIKDVAASVALVGIFISVFKGLDISWKTYIPVMLLVMVTCYLVSQSKQWKRYFRRNEDIEVEKDTTKSKVPPEAIEVTNDVYKCEICDGKSMANTYCSECEEYMSDECADSHKKQKATETHEILSFDIGHGQKKDKEKKCDQFNGESETSSCSPKCEELLSDGYEDSNKLQKSTDTHQMLSAKMAKGHIDNKEEKCDPYDGKSMASSYCSECEEYACDKCVGSNKRQEATETPEMVPAEMGKVHKKIEVAIGPYMCRPCDGKSMANIYCPECEEYLCDECVDSHKKQTATETHEMLPAEIGQGHKRDKDEKNELTIDDFKCDQSDGGSKASSCSPKCEELLSDGCVDFNKQQKATETHQMLSAKMAKGHIDNKEDKCDSCEGKSMASGFCSECEEHSCDECVDSQNKQTSTETHEMLPAEMGQEYKNDFEEQIEEIIDVYMCDPCDGESMASSFCPECEEFLCEECVKSHKKMKATKKHELLAAEMGKEHKTMEDETEKNVPGKPNAVEEFPDSIKLVWDPPTKFGDKSCYQISLKDMSSNQRWRSYHEEISEASTTITGLKSNTTYVFRVRVIYENGEESPFSKESKEIRTAASLATEMLKTSIQVPNWDKIPKKYALPIKENIAARNEKAKTRKFKVGTPPIGYVESKTIMLVGATGTGKSTFVDGIINYVLGVTWEDPFRYTIIDLEAEEAHRIKNQAASQTEWITCYTIYPESGSRLSYQLNIIDIPGFGDTRGLKRDQEIVGQIRQLFSDTEPRGVSCIDAVCFLIKAPDARLTAIQSYIFQSIMSLFGKDVEENICSLITFADGNDPPVLAALKESKLPFGKHFTFNNSALFASNCGMESQSLSPMFWNIGLTSFFAFFNHLGKMLPQSLQLTKDVLLERYRLEAIVGTLIYNLEAGLQMIDVLKSEKRVLQQHKVAMEANKNFEVEVSEPFVIKTLIPGRIHNTKCENCYVKCHPDCVFADNEDKRLCAVMDRKTGKCTICPDRCDWTAHKNDAYTYTHGVKKVKKTLNELKQMYTDASGKAKSHQEMVAKNAAQLQELTNNIEDMMLLIKSCNEKLQEIALKPNPLSVTEHIDLMIENEKLTKKEGYLTRIRVLNEFRKDAEVQKEVEVFKRVAEVELEGIASETEQVKRPLDSKSVLKRATEWLKKHIPGFSI